MLSQSAVFHKSKNFTSDCEIPMPPTVPINHYFRPAACAQQSCTHTGQQKTGPKVLFCCSMLIYSSKKCACFEHSNFFKVKPQIPRPERGKCMLRRQMNASKTDTQKYQGKRDASLAERRGNTENNASHNPQPHTKEKKSLHPEIRLRAF